MAISYVATGVATGNGTALTSVLPTGYAADDVLLWVTCSNANVTLTVAPAGYTLVRRITDSTFHIFEVYRKTAVASETAPTATWSGTARWHTHLVAYRGVDTAAPFVVENGAAIGSTATVHSAPALVNTDAAAWGVYAAACELTSPASWTPGAGLTERADTDNLFVNAANPVQVLADTASAPGTGTYTFQATSSASTSVGCMWAAFLKPAATAAAGPVHPVSQYSSFH